MRLCGIVFAYALFLLLAAPAFAEDVTMLTSAGTDFVLDPDSGTLAGIDTTAKAVVFYDSGLMFKGSEKLAGIPIGIIFKKVGKTGYFVVLSRNKGEIAVFDSASLKKTKIVTIKDSRPFMVAGSQNPDDPYIYVTESRGNTALQFNLLTNEHKTVGGNGPVIAVSARGDYFYMSCFKSHHMSLYCYRIQNGRMVRVGSKNIVRGHFYVDPYNHYCISGTRVFSTDLGTEKGKLAAGILAFFPDHAVILGLSSDAKLSLMSYNDFRVVQTLILPAKFKRGSTSDPRVRALVDVKRQRVLICKGNLILPLKYSEFKFPAEPFLLIRLDLKKRISTGKRISVKVEPLDNVQYEISKAPRGVKLDGDRLVWNPDQNQVGIHEIKLRIYSGKAESFEIYKVSVLRCGMELDFAPRAFSFSDDGKYAIVLKDGHHNSRNPSDDEIVLLDTSAGEVIARRSFKERLQAVFVDEHYVYVAPRGASEFYVLSKTDLGERKRVTCDDLVYGFDHNREGCLAAVAHGRVNYFTLPDLKPETSPRSVVPLARDYSYGRSDRPGYEQGALQDGYYVRSGAVFDADGKLTMIFKPQHCFDAISGVRREISPKYLWNRRTNKGKITTGEGILLDRFSHQSRKLMKTCPAVISTFYIGNGKRYDLVFDVQDIVMFSGKKLLKLMCEVSMRQSGQLKPLYLIERKGVAFVLFEQYLFRVELEPEFFAGLDRPLCIEPRLGKHVIATSGVTSVTYRAVGGTGRYRFELVGKHKALEINPRTGEVKIDGSKIFKSALENIRRDITKIKFDSRTGIKQFSARYSEYAGSYKELLGAQPEGIPLTIPITVNVIDSENQSCTVTHRLYIVVPCNAVLSLLEKERAASAGKPKPPTQDDPQPQDDDVAALRKEVAQLNKRTEVLEAKIDRLLRRLKARSEKSQSDEESDDGESAKDQPTSNDAKKEDE